MALNITVHRECRSRDRGVVHFVHFGRFRRSEQENRRAAPVLGVAVHFVHSILGGESNAVGVGARSARVCSLPPIRETGERSERDHFVLAQCCEKAVHFGKKSEVNGSEQTRGAGR